MNDIIKGFFVSIGFAADDTSRGKAERSMASFEKAVTDADARITKAKAEGAKAAVRYALEVEAAQAREALEAAKAAAKIEDSEKRKTKAQAEYEKKQKQAQAQAAARMRSLVNVAATTALAIETFTVALAGYATHVAAKLEAMAYASDRTKSSVQDLKVFSQAVSQLGGSAGGALSDLENFAARLRSNPQGYTAFLKSVGVEARDAQGNIRGAAELYKEFRKNVGEKPYEQQLLYMQEMGVSEQTWRATDPARLAAEEARSRAKYARLGYDPNKAAEDAKGLQHALRDMFESINIIGEKTASKIFADVGDNLKGFTTFIEQHGDQIAEILSKVAQLVLAVSRALLELLTSEKVKGGLDWLMGMFGHVEEGSGKWVADTEKIKSALEALAVFIATVFVAKITGAFADILKELKPLLLLLAPVMAALGIPILGTAAVGAALGGLGDPSKSVNGTGGRPDGQLNPGDELPGVGGGTPATAGGEGAWARAKRLGRAALNAVGLGGSGDSTPVPAGRFSPLKALIQGQESGSASYNSVYGNGKYGWPDKPVTQMTIKDILAYQRRMRNQVGSSAFPVGRAQFVERTLRRLAQETGSMDEVFTPELQEKFFDRLIRGRGRDVAGLRAEWDGLNRVDADRILKAYDTDGSQGGGASAQSSAGRKPGWIDKDTYTDGLNVFKRGADGNLSRVTNIPGQPSTSSGLPSLAGAVAKFGDGMNRLDMDKFRGIGAATQGFDPSQFLNAPPVGASTSNDNSVKNQSYTGGTTNVTINTHGDVRETAELWRRHGERQKADDLRYASSMFA